MKEWGSWKVTGEKGTGCDKGTGGVEEGERREKGRGRRRG